MTGGCCGPTSVAGFEVHGGRAVDGDLSGVDVVDTGLYTLARAGEEITLRIELAAATGP